MRRRPSSERGQALPLALAGCLVLLAACLFLFHSGRLIYKRAQVRARADLTALSAGVDYARCLNLLAFSEKAYGAALVGDAAMFAVTEGGYLTSILSGRSLTQMTAQLQKALIWAGAWAVAASTMHIGWENELLALPVWNQPEGSVIPDLESLYPDLNVEQQGILQQQVERLAQAIRQGLTIARDSTEEYWQRKRKSGRLVRVRSYEVERIRIRRRGRTVTAWRHKGTKKFVARRARPHWDIAFEPKDLVDLGNHSITLWALSRDRTESAGRRLPHMAAVSKVRVEGGNLDFWSWSSSEYEPYFVPLRESGQPAGRFPRLMRTGVNKIDAYIERINAAASLLSGEGVLH